jgi:hypothetical protein
VDRYEARRLTSHQRMNMRRPGSSAMCFRNAPLVSHSVINSSTDDDGEYSQIWVCITPQMSRAARHPEPSPPKVHSSTQAHEQCERGCIVERLSGQMGTVVDVVVLVVRQAPVQPGDHQPFCRVRLLCRLCFMVALIFEARTREPLNCACVGYVQQVPPASLHQHGGILE